MLLAISGSIYLTLFEIMVDFWSKKGVPPDALISHRVTVEKASGANQTSLPQAPVYSVKNVSYSVPSATTHGVIYTVSQEPGGSLHCECKVAQVGRYACWHVKRVKAGMV